MTVSAKVPVELRRRLAELGIKPAPVIRRALEEEIRRKIREELYQEADVLATILAKVSDEDVARAIRESRDQR